MNRLLTTLIQLGMCAFACVVMSLIKSYYKEERQTHIVSEPTKRIVYCDGRKTNVVHVVMVDAETFWAFDLEQQPYGLIDRNSRTIYLDVRRYESKR